MYAVGACVILILVIMGVSLFNSFDRMKSVQNTLGFLDKETVASDGKTSEETTDDGSVPTSAEIEAVKGQTDADSADENKTKEESVSGQKEDGKDVPVFLLEKHTGACNMPFWWLKRDTSQNNNSIETTGV